MWNWSNSVPFHSLCCLATVNYHPTVSDLYAKKLSGTTNHQQQPHKNCALNVSNHHCCSVYNQPNNHQNNNNYLNGRDYDSTKDPYWLQQAKRSNKIARKDQRFGLFSRKPLSMGISESSALNARNQKAQYHTYVVNGMDLLREPNLNKVSVNYFTIWNDLHSFKQTHFD